MSEHEEMVFDIRTEGVEESKIKLMDLNRTVAIATSSSYGLISILKRLSGSEDVRKNIDEVMRLLAVINMLRTSIMLLNMSTPWGLPFAAIGIAGTLITIGDQLSYSVRE